ncbi:unnamed protein product [Acanthoscelides obtectus]|uniref:Uncharacterized protein n=1 Tax=Acanthoscelides obtectus TaxID=200917 RepID=A0A9P0PZI9_ACAOB|nr:unnamed protein product [Acanthoscelides obtectus]CAK1634077.1 hypothetical protein AOBTE_LOCUS8587 [Acanthoscelides obtectus]
MKYSFRQLSAHQPFITNRIPWRRHSNFCKLRHYR